MKFKSLRLHKWMIILLLVAITQSGPLTANTFDEEDYTRYKNSKFRFSILIPKYWNREVANLEYKQVITLHKGRYTLIKITSAATDPQEKRKWDTIKDWYLTGLGRRANKIIETEEISINRGVKGRLYIIEFRKHRKRMLRRILVSRYNDKILVVECGSSVKKFYNYSEIFNNVMGSILFNETSRIELDTDKKSREKEIEKTREDTEKIKPHDKKAQEKESLTKDDVQIEEDADKKSDNQKESPADERKNEPEKKTEKKLSPKKEKSTENKELTDIDKMMDDY